MEREPMTRPSARASAPANIAIVKYFGKRDPVLNLPRSPSLSASLSRLRSWARVEPGEGHDLLEIQGDPTRSHRVIAAARATVGDFGPVRVRISNTFPTATGLASSASSMAALARALAAFSGMRIPGNEIDRWARVGSGSAVRSLHRGWVLWEPGTDPSGSDCRARTVLAPGRFPLDVAICVVDDRPKPVGSTEAMERCRLTSPAYEDFHRRNSADIDEALAALRRGDTVALARVAEANCLRMHGMLRIANPPIDYFLPGTREAIERVRDLARQDVPCFFTVDAGPNVVVFAPPGEGDRVEAALAALPGTIAVLRDRAGGG
jgi:diphosphomevalonate decarboxylase